MEVVEAAIVENIETQDHEGQVNYWSGSLLDFKVVK